MFQNKQKELENTEKQNRIFFETNTIFVALMEQGKDEKLLAEWPRGTSRCCILPP